MIVARSNGMARGRRTCLQSLAVCCLLPRSRDEDVYGMWSRACGGLARDVAQAGHARGHGCCVICTALPGR